MEQYADYVEDNTFTDATNHPFPTLLCICPTKSLINYLKKYLVKLAESCSIDSITIYLATKEGALSGQWEPVIFDEYD
jgi:hypothetical protein